MLVAHYRLITKSKAYPVGVLAYLRQSFLVIVVLVTVNAVGVDLICTLFLQKGAKNDFDYLTVDSVILHYKRDCGTLSKIAKS